MAIKRNIRVSRLVHQIVGETLMTKMRNVEASRANIQKVEVSENLRHVKIYVTVTGDEEQRKATMSALKQARGFIRHEIGAQSDLKYVPQIEFIYDDTLDYMEKINHILRSLKK
ncbi:MAG: 30S ribosome-binding factor RbfA [candidate division KSB1 bacterium]|nr:30S ribosome-binding factor RbfA [candidate division KSB1 bacterium]MDQ7062730.1 30S ribosome-binding factor RbfA [candidate division KSB1 bacterium]